ncbi:predicted protein [Scheffersomyces stipitis CBS 6054]|uniref:Ubiquitin-like domain-containing protein n=1 Tax=Scheffersomyces stipitis (strain ATCC 58785 / CBS 6054 / NBRC 10063 / NRRL Y-11545) TaxID=322104 RepID=A3LP74_PICST|nr:predicted protein [Scheffersomyces stipitis CBS 6054]ABN64448.2 predicted protein [Scheffersomyces stipitis CBS 6054]
MRFVLVIRFTDTSSSTQPVRDLDIPLAINFDKDDVNKLVSVKWIKSVIRARVPQAASSRLRLIYSGRVLNENTNFRAEVKQPEKSKENRIYIHCVIGEELTREQLAEENKLDKPQAVSTTPQVVGFDRLLQQGFSQEDVDDLRRQFYSIYSPGSLGNSTRDQISDVEEEENNQRAIHQLEERWIESTVNGGNAENATGDNQPFNAPHTATAAQDAPPQPSADLDDIHGNEELLLGLLLGIFLGVISIVFLMADDSVFNKRTKHSVILGFIINIGLAVSRGRWL